MCNAGFPDKLDDVQLAKALRAKRITDPAKLAAMYPAWLKTHIRNSAPPKPFKPDFTQHFPARCKPNTIHAPVLTIPQGKYKTTAEYVAEFDKANGLVTPDRAREIAAERKAEAQRQRTAKRDAKAAAEDYERRFARRKKPANAEMAA